MPGKKRYRAFNVSKDQVIVGHLLEEMRNRELVLLIQDLLAEDLNGRFAGGRIKRRLTRDPRGTRYEVVGTATDERQIAIICRIKDTGKLLFITTYALE